DLPARGLVSGPVTDDVGAPPRTPRPHLVEQPPVGLGELAVHEGVEEGVDTAVEPGEAGNDGVDHRRSPGAAVQDVEEAEGQVAGHEDAEGGDAHSGDAVGVRPRPGLGRRGRRSSLGLPRGSGALNLTRGRPLLPVRLQRAACVTHPLGQEAVEDANGGQAHPKKQHHQDAGVRPPRLAVEAAGADSRLELEDGPERGEEGQGEEPGARQEDGRQDAPGAAGVGQPRAPCPPHQGVPGPGDQPQREDGGGIGGEQQEAEDPAGGAAPPPTDPAHPQVAGRGHGLQEGAVEEVGQRQVQDQQVEAAPQAGVHREGQDGQQIPGASHRGHQQPQRCPKVAVLGQRGVAAPVGLHLQGDGA
ncbi:hypothetical protein chiPu_0025944, partial [Chiloscyllium punctatum]|nr:hypothetical protein [Chiloscyllium punctatum]